MITVFKGGGVAELVARPPTYPKVHSSNHRGPAGPCSYRPARGNK
jgi:hypothetical protein